MIEFPLRTSHDLCSGWDFVRGRVGRRWLAGHGEDTERVDLPHCWNTTDTYQYGVKSYRGFGAYRLRVRLPEAETDGTWYLRSDGFYGTGEVWLDGRRMCRFDGQYIGLDIPLPPSFARGSHLLSIRLDNRYHRDVLPGRKDPDFLLYGGLAGGLRLENRPWPGIEVGSTEVRCRTDRTGAEHVELRARVSNPHGAADGGNLAWTITTEEGEVVARTEPVATEGLTKAAATITEPRCWSPDQPHLYWAEGRFASAHGHADTIRVRFGITRAEFRADRGFFLDGERVDLHGVNRHESIPGLGSALPMELHLFDAQLLKDIGCNFVRLSHYPQHPAFLDACDELGIMVYSEIASWKSVSPRRGWRRAALRQFNALIRRDRHHPSVIVWGMGNESRSRRTYLEMRALARQLDPARPVTYAENHLYRARRKKTVGIPDVWGTNYELEALEGGRDSSRLRTVVLSECCNHPTSIRGEEAEELTQLSVIEREWQTMTGRDYLAGHAIWSFTDYATEHRNRTRRQTGLFDAWRRPKMAAELFRARYSRDPFVALFLVRSRIEGSPSRFRKETEPPGGNEAKEWLHVFTNCETTRIVQGDSILGVLEGALHYVVPFDSSRGAVTAVGRLGSETVEGHWQPHGKAVAIELARFDKQDGRAGTAVIDISIVDAAGRLVTDWNGHVAVRGLGDARVHAYTTAGEVLVTRGEGRIFVSPSPAGTETVINAEADGLEPGRLVLGSPD